MKGRFSALMKLGTAISTVALLTPTAVRPDGLTGCMGMAVEQDLLYNDIWHGGEDMPPEMDPDCDFIDDECEFGEVFEDAIHQNYHSNWTEGILGENHPFVYPVGWWCFSGGGN